MPHVVCQMDATNGLDYRPLLGHPVLLDWLTALGENPKTCKAFRVLSDDTVQITDYVFGPDGKRVLNPTGHEALTETHTVPLSAPVPPLVLEHCRV